MTPLFRGVTKIEPEIIYPVLNRASKPKNQNSKIQNKYFEFLFSVSGLFGMRFERWPQGRRGKLPLNPLRKLPIKKSSKA